MSVLDFLVSLRFLLLYLVCMSGNFFVVINFIRYMKFKFNVFIRSKEIFFYLVVRYFFFIYLDSKIFNF